MMHKNNIKYWVYYLIFENISTADFAKYVIIDTVLVTSKKILIPIRSQNALILVFAYLPY